MDNLINYLLHFGHLNKQQIELVKSKVKAMELAKDDYFSEAGKIARQIGFIGEGIMRVCYYNNKGKEITKYFIDENNFVVDINSLSNKIPSTGYVQAITDCKPLVFSQTVPHALSTSRQEDDGQG
jgi:CRP-like cAMP-binding protein